MRTIYTRFYCAMNYQFQIQTVLRKNNFSFHLNRRDVICYGSPLKFSSIFICCYVSFVYVCTFYVEYNFTCYHTSALLFSALIINYDPHIINPQYSKWWQQVDKAKSQHPRKSSSHQQQQHRKTVCK